MSYYLIQMRESYEVLKNCPKCKSKSHYKNTNSFRVNANGKQLDIWLIYQCETCKSTYNLTIYERIKTSALPKEEYEGFLNNDADLAFYYGTKKTLFSSNKAEINTSNISYDIIRIKKDGQDSKERIIIENPYEIKIRTDKVISEIMQISRSAVKELFQKGILSCMQDYPGEYTVVELRNMENMTEKLLLEIERRRIV